MTKRARNLKKARLDGSPWMVYYGSIFDEIHLVRKRDDWAGFDWRFALQVEPEKAVMFITYTRTIPVGWIKIGEL